MAASERMEGQYRRQDAVLVAVTRRVVLPVRFENGKRQAHSTRAGWKGLFLGPTLGVLPASLSRRFRLGKVFAVKFNGLDF